MDNLHPVVEIIVVAMLLISAFFALVGAVGMLRFKDFFQRLHAPTKATTLGVGGVLIAFVVIRQNRRLLEDYRAMVVLLDAELGKAHR